MNLLALIDRIPVLPLAIGAVVLGLAPFRPQPHVFEKLAMLVDGTLSQPVDIVDLLMHASPATLLAIRLWRARSQSGGAGSP